VKKNLSIRYTVLTLSLFLVILTGCGSSAPTRFYLLNSLSGPETGQLVSDSKDSMVIGIGPVTIPEYLDRFQIVTRTSNNKINLAEFDQWAEPMNENVSRVLVENLSQMLSTNNVSLFPSKVSDNLDYQIQIEIVDFEGKFGDKASLSVRWSILGDKGKRVLIKRKSNFKESVGSGNYEVLVAAMNKMLEDFSREIAETIKGFS
jgi:uncharacterized lipoprotein YmbA